MEAKCNICRVATYGEAGRKLLIEKQQYWCVNCLAEYRVFSPFPATYFQPEADVKHVLEKQKRFWEKGKRIIIGGINKIIINKSLSMVSIYFIEVNDISRNRSPGD